MQKEEKGRTRGPATSPPVSIVMLSFNRKDDVAEGIRQLQSQEHPNIEIIIVDNASADGTAQMVREQFPRVHLIALQENIGVSAYNIGFRAATGNYIVVLDDDSFPEKHALTRMVEEFQNDPKLGVVAFDVRNYEEFKQNPHPKQPREHVQNRQCRYQLAFNGCGVGLRKSVVQEVGGYPDEFFLYWNEQDLAIRILDAGYHIRWFTDIISYHKYSPSNRQSWRAPFFYTRNLYWLIWKHFPLTNLLKDTFKMFFYTLYYTLEQKTFVYLKGALSALFNIKQIKRRPVAKKIIRDLRLTYKLAFIYFK